MRYCLWLMERTAIVPRVPARIVLASIAGLWLCYFLLATLRGWVLDFELDWPMLSRRTAVMIASMAVTALLWPLLVLLERRRLWVKVPAMLLAALPAALLLAKLNQWIFADIESQVVKSVGERQGINIRRDEAGNLLVDIPDEMTARQPGKAHVLLDAATDRENDWRQITDLAIGRYFLLLAWCALFLALASAEQARAAERREGEYRRAAKASELRSLRYQINPHFLFNTLNSLSALVMTGKGERAERMIQTLSTFYRRSLAEDPTSDHSLAEEIEMQKLYLEIESVRFPERLRTRCDIPEDLGRAPVPGLILQPLVENSVKYAVATSNRPVTIVIAARAEGEHLVLEVSDDGPGAGAVKPAGAGIGLANVRDRLSARFGGAAGVDSSRAESGGYRTVIRLPLVRGHG